MRAVALFRNVNQGQRGHPATADLLAAFADAGAPGAVGFQSNGTIVFDAEASAEDLAENVVSALAARSGQVRECFTMSLDEVVRIVDAHAGRNDAARCEFTLHSGGALDVDDPAVVEEAAHRRCLILASGAGWAVSTNERDRESNATPVIERLTGGPATSRSLATMRRLVDRSAGQRPRT